MDDRRLWIDECGRTLRGITLCAALAGSLAAGCGSSEVPDRAGERSTPDRPSILLVTLDTTRADHVGVYGYDRPTTPNLDRLAADGIVFDQALSSSSWTLPAHGSLFTGMVPTSHGARNDPQGELYLADAIEAPDSWRVYRASRLRDDVPTLADLLARDGYATGAVVGGPWMKQIFGLGRGFEHYDDSAIDTLNGRDASSVSDAALAWVEARQGPFLLFLNYYDPHTPYKVRKRYLELFVPEGTPATGAAETPEQVRALYDSELRYTDDQLGRVLDGLRTRGLYDDLWIVVTADHGELQGEHGLSGHGSTLYDEELHIPLIVKQPGNARAGERVARPIQLTDVMPMLLRGLGRPVPESVQGDPDGSSPVFAEVYPLPQLSDAGDYRMLREGAWTFLWNSRGEHRLFHRERDPLEERDLRAEEPEQATAMADRLERFVQGLPRPGRSGETELVDPETREALKNLGYLE